MVNSKTTAVRVIPAIGRSDDDEVEFGGLFGSSPIMKVNTSSPAKFINRGGRIPAPLQSPKTKACNYKGKKRYAVFGAPLFYCCFLLLLLPITFCIAGKIPIALSVRKRFLLSAQRQKIKGTSNEVP